MPLARSMLLAHEAAGRHLLEDPAFEAMARAYERARATVPPRGSIRDAKEGRWYVLALVPGSEREAIDRIADEVRVPLYLPMRREARIDYRGRWRHVRRALFTGYGFVQLADIDNLFGRIASTEGVRGFLCCRDGEPAIVRAGYDACRKGQSGFLWFDWELIDFIRQVEAGASDWLSDLPAAPAPGRQRNCGKSRKRKRARARKLTA
jgi:hypothetical protein